MTLFSIAKRQPQSCLHHITRRFMSNPSLKRFSMPIDRLRALITLYHDTRTMVTRDNLSAHIDAVFLRRHKLNLADVYDYATLTRALVEKRKGKPVELVYKGVPLNYQESRAWSDESSIREAQIHGALWGTQPDGKAGLETILETVEMAEREERLLNQSAAPPQTTDSAFLQQADFKREREKEQ